MKIVLATPLFPPDIAEPAPYVKELAKRLARRHSVTVVAYGNLLEKVQGVELVAVDKRQPLPVRLLIFLFALLKASAGARLIYIQNGPSVELPAGLVARLLRKPLCMRLGDSAAHEYAQTHAWRRAIERFALRRARTINAPSMARPEILPLEPWPDVPLAQWEASWQAHIEELEKTFNGA